VLAGFKAAQWELEDSEVITTTTTSPISTTYKHPICQLNLLGSRANRATALKFRPTAAGFVKTQHVPNAKFVFVVKSTTAVTY